MKCKGAFSCARVRSTVQTYSSVTDHFKLPIHLLRGRVLTSNLAMIISCSGSWRPLQSFEYDSEKLFDSHRTDTGSSPRPQRVTERAVLVILVLTASNWRRRPASTPCGERLRSNVRRVPCCRATGPCACARQWRRVSTRIRVSGSGTRHGAESNPSRRFLEGFCFGRLRL